MTIKARILSAVSDNFITVRRSVQFLFLAVCIFIGIQFYLFVSQLAANVPVTVQRPPGVEAFLPISALVSLKYFFLTGIINTIHPSGLIIFIAICATSIMFKRIFCSWICPFGLLSDYLEKLHLHIFGKKLKLPSWMDTPLRGIKYFIAGFFIWSVFIKMPAIDIEQFIGSSYNTFADVKMLEFFTRMSAVSFTVIISLTILSVIIDRFWCRYLCPYGALLGILGLFSMGKITRNGQNCIKCGKCEKVCPGVIPITKKKKINSLECMVCLRCIDACPVDNAIDLSVLSEKIPMNQIKIASVLIVFFTVCIIGAKLSDHWRNNVPVAAYRHYVLENNIISDKPMKISRHEMKQMIEIMRKIHKQKK